MSWTKPLQCGCVIDTVVDGVAQVNMFDGLDGLNVQCPEHGWTVEVVYVAHFTDVCASCERPYTDERPEVMPMLCQACVDSLVEGNDPLTTNEEV